MLATLFLYMGNDMYYFCHDEKQSIYPFYKLFYYTAYMDCFYISVTYSINASAYMSKLLIQSSVNNFLSNSL